MDTEFYPSNETNKQTRKNKWEEKWTVLYPIILVFACNHTQLSKMHLREYYSGSDAQNLL